MDILIRDYQEGDKKFLMHCMTEMQKHVAPLDPMKKSRPAEDFNKDQYVKNLLQRVKKNKGTMYIAEYKGEKVGCVGGIIKETAQVDLVDEFPCKAGRIIELFVTSGARGKNIGTQLMRKIETYFRAKHCDITELGVFITNIVARKFYRRHGYIDRNIEMGKKLESS